MKVFSCLLCHSSLEYTIWDLNKSLKLCTTTTTVLIFFQPCSFSFFELPVQLQCRAWNITCFSSLLENNKAKENNLFFLFGKLRLSHNLVSLYKGSKSTGSKANKMKMTNSKPINQVVKGGKEVSSRCEKSEYNYMNVLSS